MPERKPLTAEQIKRIRKLRSGRRTFEARLHDISPFVEPEPKPEPRWEPTRANLEAWLGGRDE